MKPARWLVAAASIAALAGLFAPLSASAAPPKSLTWEPTTTPSSLVRDNDLVGSWNVNDSYRDGRFHLVLYSRLSDRLTQLTLRDPKSGNTWNTVASDGAWALGVTNHSATTLLNSADTSLPAATFTFSGSKTFDLWAGSSWTPPKCVYDTAFAPGTTFIVTAVFNSGRTVKLRETIPQ